MPPPWVKIGSPINPNSMYKPTLMAPSFPPKSNPANIVNKNCNVKGTTGIGILIKAPMVMSAANKLTNVISLIRNVFIFCLLNH